MASISDLHPNLGLLVVWQAVAARVEVGEVGRGCSFHPQAQNWRQEEEQEESIPQNHLVSILQSLVTGVWFLVFSSSSSKLTSLRPR